MNLGSKFGLTLLAAVIVSILLLIFSIKNGNPGVFPPLPTPNGYDDFIAAGNLLSGQNTDPNEMNLEQLRGFIGTNAESLRLLQLGLTRTCAVPLATSVTNQSRMLEDLGTIKRLAQFSIAVGRLAELEGRTNEAVAIYLQGMRFASEAIRGGVIIHNLVGVGCEGMAFIQLTNLMARISLTQAQEIIVELEQLDAAAITWKEAMKWETIFMSHVAPFDGDPITWIRGWWANRSLLQKEEERHLRRVVRRRRFLVELALRCHVDAQGNPPQKLDELVPAYLSRLPENPATKQPPSYYPRGTNWSLEFKL